MSARATRSCTSKASTAVATEASIGFATVDNEELLLLVTRDITERKRLENRLRRQWGFFSRLVHKNVDGIMAFDRSFNITYWNPAMERILGIRKSKLLGKNAFQTRGLHRR